METVVQDLRFGARALGRQPAFTFVALFTLAVGIGANSAIFSVVNATLLRPLPFQEPARLMRVSLVIPSQPGEPGMDDLVWSYPKYRTFRELQQAFESAATYRKEAFNVTGAGDAERVEGESAGADYFPLLRIVPEAGRLFTAEEDALPGGQMVALISDGLWTRRFGRDPNVTAKMIELDGRNCRIVGVLPAGFRGLTGTAEIWIPTTSRGGEELSQRWSHSYDLVARLKPGVTAAQAKSEVERLGPRIDEAHPSPFPSAPWGAKARTLDEARTDPALRTSVLILFGAVGFVLLIACVNLANLLLARGNARLREIAVRLAVGARRMRLVRQLLTESALLSLLGALAGLALAWWGVSLILSIGPAGFGSLGHRLSGLTLIGLSTIRLDGSVMLFTLGVALLTAFLFGVLPAVQASRIDVADALRSAGSRSSSLGVAGFRASGSLLIAGEVALALVLLIGAGLMIRSLERLLSVRTGIDPENLVTLRVSMAWDQYSRQAMGRNLTEIESRLAALPGIESVGMSDCPPVAGGCNRTVIWFRDRPEVPRGSEPGIGVHTVSPGYLSTLRIPLIRGRWFTAADFAGRPKVVVISEMAARRFWPNEDPIGRPIAVGQGGFHDRAEVIGIVGDVRYGTLEEPPFPDVYMSFLQSPKGNATIFLRTRLSAGSIVPAMRREVTAVDKSLPIFDIKPMRERIGQTASRMRYSALLLGVFAFIALALASVGIYGVMSYGVAQRTHEIGIRIALGARPVEVVALVVRRGMTLTLAGIIVGLAAALALSRTLSSLLYGIRPTDPATYALLALLLGAVAFLASYLPAQRAAKVDPLEALRAE
mgnify:CR=1 FL=1